MQKNTALQWLIFLILVCFTVFKLITNTGLQLIAGALISFPDYALSGNGMLFITILVLALQLLFLQIYVQKKHFLGKFSLFPAIFYLALMNCGSFLTHISTAFFTNLCFILVLNLVNDDVSKSAKTRALFAGMCMGIGVCIDLVTAILLLFFTISLTINLSSKVKDIFICFIGLITSFIYIGAYYFFTDNLLVLYEKLQKITFLNIFTDISALSIFDIVTFSIFILTLIYIVIKISVLYKSRLIVLRKNLSMLHLSFFCLFLAVFLTSLSYPAVLQYLFLPTTIYLTILAQEKSRFFISEFLFIILIVVLCI